MNRTALKKELKDTKVFDLSLLGRALCFGRRGWTSLAVVDVADAWGVGVG